MKRISFIVALLLVGCASPSITTYNRLADDPNAHAFEVRRSGFFTTDVTLFIDGAPVDTVKNLSSFWKLSDTKTKEWNGRRLMFYAAVDWWDGELSYQVTVNNELVAQKMK